MYVRFSPTRPIPRQTARFGAARVKTPLDSALLETAQKIHVAMALLLRKTAAFQGVKAKWPDVSDLDRQDASAVQSLLLTLLLCRFKTTSALRQSALDQMFDLLQNPYLLNSADTSPVEREIHRAAACALRELLPQHETPDQRKAILGQWFEAWLTSHTTYREA